ncbi:MAG TPA: small, acid-soluble spore protein, H family [Bacilli bacterium]
MNIERAKEILHATETIDVQLNGQSVWIESVNPDKTVNVRLMESGSPQKKVLPDELQEM